MQARSNTRLHARSEDTHQSKYGSGGDLSRRFMPKVDGTGGERRGQGRRLSMCPK